ncbi:hypothetical protein MEQU1_002912 [Malassezia equina]|uniref:Uncharacterized protein n=1 Tax=Malassezia equina TaxID=1381935 RepID=A0AAF0EGI7_9BASI|nr:hypothetical protein MEQU1_002912 [Malassezia equina]
MTAPRYDDALQMRPRHVQAETAYVDRAALRRSGADTPTDTSDAFAHAAGRTKGLDLELLARERARIAQESAKEPSPPREEATETEESLDAALEEGRRAQERAREITERIAAARAKFRRVGEEPEVIYVNGKKMRRKRKAETPAAIASTQPDPPTKSTRTAPPPAFAVQVNDAEEDIFGEADVWGGLSDEDTGDPTQDAAATAPTSSTQRPKAHGWVSDTQEEPVSNEAIPPAPHDDNVESAPAPASERLEGLSSSALPSEWSRWMLERADAPRPPRPEPRSRRRRRGRDASASP